MESEKFCLRWNDFETNISSAFKELREEKDFFDVTLACDDSQMQAHKVILSACSPFFRTILRHNPHPHPLLYLKGVKYQDLLSVLNFMYMGEVSVAQEELNTFLAVAEDLKIKGLTQEKHNQPKPTETPIKDQKENEGPFNKGQIEEVNRHSKVNYSSQPKPRATILNDFQEMSPVKCEPYDPAPQQYISEHPPHQNTVALEEGYAADDSYDYLYEEGHAGGMETAATVADTTADPLAAREAAITSHIVRDSERKLFTCDLCQFGTTGRYKVFCHIEAKHFQDSPVTYSCQYCTKTASSRNALGIHLTREHKQERMKDKNEHQFRM